MEVRLSSGHNLGDISDKNNRLHNEIMDLIEKRNLRDSGGVRGSRVVYDQMVTEIRVKSPEKNNALDEENDTVITITQKSPRPSLTKIKRDDAARINSLKLLQQKPKYFDELGETMRIKDQMLQNEVRREHELKNELYLMQQELENRNLMLQDLQFSTDSFVERNSYLENQIINLTQMAEQLIQGHKELKANNERLRSFLPEVMTRMSQDDQNLDDEVKIEELED